VLFIFACMRFCKFLKPTFLFLFLLSFCVNYAQQSVLIDSVAFEGGSNYNYDLHFSPKQDLISFSVNQMGGAILDTNLNLLKRVYFEGYQNSGFCTYSFDQKYILQINDNYEAGVSELSVQSTLDSSVEFVQRPVFTKFIPFKHANKVLFYADGIFDIYDLETGNISKNVIDISESWTRSITSMMLYQNDSKLLLNYTKRPPAFTDLEVYNMEDFSLAKRIPKPAFNIGETKLSEDRTLYYYSLKQPDFIEESIHLKSTNNDAFIDSIPTNLLNILDVVLSPDNSFLLIRDLHLSVYYFSRLKRKLVPILIGQLDDSFDTMAICPDNKHFIISRNGNMILKYRID
jgi:hypothetical protein